MAKLRVGMTTSVDGFVCDSERNFGMLYEDMDEFRDSSYLQEEINECGAVVMGRNCFDEGNGDFTGYEYQVPIFVVTHTPPTEEIKGQNDKMKIIFVTDGLESAVAQAKQAAGDKYVVSMGGADTAHQLLNAGLVDELDIDIVPVVLKNGKRFIDDLTVDLKLEKIGVHEIGQRTGIRFRVIK